MLHFMFLLYLKVLWRSMSIDEVKRTFSKLLVKQSVGKVSRLETCALKISSLLRHIKLSAFRKWFRLCQKMYTDL